MDSAYVSDLFPFDSFGKYMALWSRMHVYFFVVKFVRVFAISSILRTFLASPLKCQHCNHLAEKLTDSNNPFCLCQCARDSWKNTVCVVLQGRGWISPGAILRPSFFSTLLSHTRFLICVPPLSRHCWKPTVITQNTTLDIRFTNSQPLPHLFRVLLIHNNTWPIHTPFHWLAVFHRNSRQVIKEMFYVVMTFKQSNVRCIVR